MRKDALLKLADILENEVKDENFNMNDWKCGTQACAIGHAMTHKWFTDRKFRNKNNECGNIVPIYKEYNGWDAIEKFFQITGEEAYYLFDDDESRKDNITRWSVS